MTHPSAAAESFACFSQNKKLKKQKKQNMRHPRLTHPNEQTERQVCICTTTQLRTSGDQYGDPFGLRFAVSDMTLYVCPHL
jgi:hypothetical protein